MTSRETCFLCFVQNGARFWKCLWVYFPLKQVKASIKFSKKTKWIHCGAPFGTPGFSSLLSDKLTPSCWLLKKTMTSCVFLYLDNVPPIIYHLQNQALEKSTSYPTLYRIKHLPLFLNNIRSRGIFEPKHIYVAVNPSLYNLLSKRLKKCGLTITDLFVTKIVGRRIRMFEHGKPNVNAKFRETDK